MVGLAWYMGLTGNIYKSWGGVEANVRKKETLQGTENKKKKNINKNEFIKLLKRKAQKQNSKRLKIVMKKSAEGEEKKWDCLACKESRIEDIR